MDAKKDLLFVILVMLALGVVWAFTGGPERARRDPGSFLKPPSPLDTGEVYGEITLGGPTGVKIETGTNVTQENTFSIQDDTASIVDTNKARGNISQFKDKITIAKNVSGPRETSVTKEYLRLNVPDTNNENIPLNGWKLESIVTGKIFEIGGATEVYRSGVVNSESVIQAQPGETIIVATGRSPVGASFKINKCIGYLEQFQDFSPSLQRACPSATNELDQVIATIPINDLVCENFVRGIRRCEMPLSTPPAGISSQCSTFISNTINYAGCIKNHRNDLDFIGKEWRIFLGRSEEIWRDRRETIQLLDNTGRVVDSYTY